jgi:hypothetical protein
MGGLFYLASKGFLVTITAAQLVTGLALCANPMTFPVGAAFISGAEASAAMLLSPVDPLSVTVALVTGPV